MKRVFLLLEVEEHRIDRILPEDFEIVIVTAPVLSRDQIVNSFSEFRSTLGGASLGE
jgi:hypothetical protein